MGVKLTTTEFIFKARQVHGDKYDYSKTVYTRSRDKVTIVCPKVNATKARNHTFRASKPEDDMYRLLCDKFGVDDVVRQYKSERYPFRCDFYVIDLDLFIELNAGWFHGYRWFDGSDVVCQELLKKWRNGLANGHKLYGNAIHTWTVRDVKKLKIALENRLNYLAFWKSDLSDFKEWLESEPLSLCNI